MVVVEMESLLVTPMPSFLETTSRIQSADQNERLNIDKRLQGLYGNIDVLISVSSLSPEKVNDTSNLGSVSTNWDCRNKDYDKNSSDPRLI